METNQLRRSKSNKRKNKWPSWVILILVLILATISIATLTNFIQENRHQEDAVSVKINSEQIESGVYLQTESKEADTFTSFVTYPYTKIAEIDVPIREWVLDQEEKFYEEMETVETMLGESF